MSDIEIFKNGFKAYLHANSSMNAKKLAEHIKKNQELLSTGKVPSYIQPQHIQPSFQDMLYWLYESGEYVTAKSKKKESYET